MAFLISLQGEAGEVAQAGESEISSRVESNPMTFGGLPELLTRLISYETSL